LALLNQIAEGYIKQVKGDSALIYLNQALPLAKKLNDAEMTGTLLNNLGSAHKANENWQEAEVYLRQSVHHNKTVQGDSASVLAYTYFHLAGVMQAKAEADSSRYYAKISQNIAQKHALTELLENIDALLHSFEETSRKR